MNPGAVCCVVCWAVIGGLCIAGVHSNRRANREAVERENERMRRLGDELFGLWHDEEDPRQEFEEDARIIEEARLMGLFASQLEEIRSLPIADPWDVAL